MNMLDNSIVSTLNFLNFINVCAYIGEFPHFLEQNEGFRYKGEWCLYSQIFQQRQ